MKETFRALLAQEHEGKDRAVLQDLRPADLPDHGLLVEISHSTLNYKDALAVSGKGRICRSLPMVCGIDLAGKVLESRTSRFHPGDGVIVNGCGLSERHWGGYSEYQRVDPDWAIRLPDAFNAEQAMGIGTAGYTAMLCVDALQRHGLKQEEGPILVTGASGGVGSVAVMLLAKLGYDVTASTGRATANAEFLTRLGARTVVDREEFARQSKPLESERWAGAVDCVGGEVLATALAQTRYGGIVAACGLAGSANLHTTVMPFILRGVTLAGIDSVMAPLAARERAWQRLAELVDLALLETIYSVAPLTDVPRLAEGLLAGQVRGRIVVDVRR
ncbi:MAG: MDR family oxidoreductase [Steroidobacteraceae bacterium]